MKPCKLVLIKRHPADEEARKAYEPEYYVVRELVGKGNHDWVRFQSNATLFNKNDAKRDLLPHLSSSSIHQIIVNHHCIPTLFEMVELVEKQSFAWIIKRHLGGPENDGAGITQYLRAVWPDERDMFQWANSPLNSTLMSTDMRDTLLTKMRESNPNMKFEAQELFTQ